MKQADCMAVLSVAMARILHAVSQYVQDQIAQ